MDSNATKNQSPLQDRRYSMKIIEELIERKNELGYTNEMISEKSGVPVSTVNKIFGRQTAKPRYNTLQSLHCMLFPEEHSRKDAAIYKDISENLALDHSDRVAESSALKEYGIDAPEIGYKVLLEKITSWKEPGEYTVEDWQNLPDGAMMELIDGVLYDRSTPSKKHQFIVTKIVSQLDAAIERSGHENCIVFTAPTGVQIDPDDEKNGLIPDVFIVCDEKKYAGDSEDIIGAPDFVAEVLSPSAAKYDRGRKFNKYWLAGVREYWIIDLILENIYVYLFEEGVPPKKYTFEDRIPLSISGGEIAVDFKSISKLMNKLFG